MKTIKRLLLLFFLMGISSGYALTNYCATPRSSANPSGTYTLNYTCRNVSGTTYEMKLEFANTTGGNANANIASNPGGVNVAASPVWSNANKTLTYQFTSSSTPVLFVATIFVIISGTEVRWDLPTDANFAATCGGGGNPAPVFGAFSIPNKSVGDADFTIPQPTTDSGGAITYTSGTTSVATIVSGNMLHIVGAGTSTITLNQAADATHSAGSTTAIITVTAAGGGAPATAAPTPPARNAWDVISLYSGSYSTLVGATWQHGTNVTIAGDQTRYLDNMLLARLAFPPTNISAMTTMHIDVYSATLNPMWFQLQGNSLTKATPINGWVSLDIPLSQWVGLNLAGISFFDLNNPTGAVAPADNVYVDNVYFYRAATTQPPTLGALTVPAKVVGDADFAITPPTSNSAGAWSYSSSNTAVATIVSGNMIHIVGGGTSTITATQAADGVYGQGVATATFTVTFPPLTTPAPTPPVRVSTDVMSVYSNAYTPVPGTRNYNPNWGQSTVVTNETIGADNLLKYSNLNFQGTDFGGNIDVSGMTFVHIDVYSLNETSLSFYLISTATGERQVALTPLTQNGWNSYDIPLTSYTSQSGFSVASLFQFKMVGSGGKTIYVDNMYFWKPAAELINPTIALGDINKMVGDADFTVSATSDSPGTISYGSSNPAVVTISGTTVHIVGAGTATITASQVASGLYNPGSTTATLTVTYPPLATAAPTPPARNPWDVISLYSSAYTPYSELACQNIASTSDVQLEGNDTKLMANFNIEIFTFTAANLTPMTTLHMDVYSNDCTAMNIWLLNNGDRNAQITLLPNQWNSIDIPMATYTNQGLNPNGVFFMKFESLNGGEKTVYVDNIYFYRPATTQPPTLTDFSIPTKAYNDSDFAITPPTSNSAGAFSYSSSNTNVATIVGGNMIHIVGGGTSTITATQAPDGGSYGTASITAPFNVTFAPPSASPVPPARTSDRVISMFTGNPAVYTNAITAVSAPWSGATMTEIPNGTNTALQLDNFGFLGLTDQTEVRFDVSGMSHLHIDIYLNEPLNANPALSRVNIYLLANGDYVYQTSNLTAGWNSLSIPMTNFSAANLTQVWGLKLESINAATQVYIDNVYFSNECYTYYEDADNDGYGNPAVSQVACAGTPAGYILDNTDCNDAINAIHPGATEIAYNGVDDNCDGTIDEGFPQITTSLLAANCNSTLSSIGSLIGITTLAPGSAYTGWRIRLTNGAQVQVIETNVPHFTLTQFPAYDYATTYTVDIQLQRNGIWLGYYGPTCQVSSPAILAQGGAASVSPSQCGITLPKINTLIATTSLPGVTGYRFRVTNLTLSTGPNVVQTIDRVQNWFSLQMLSQYNYGSTYRIEVAVKTGSGQFGGFGSPCEVSSPAAPSLINCGGIAASGTTTVAATSVSGATQYRFQIVRSTDSASTTIDRSTNYFIFNSVPAAAFSAGTIYNVRVAVMTAGSWSPFGDVCEITSPGTASRGALATVTGTAVDKDFTVTSYPNPYTSDFDIDIATPSQEKVQVKIYDMLGKLVEYTEVDAADTKTIKVGAQFPSGVYNVIVTQGAFLKTQRVIKR